MKTKRLPVKGVLWCAVATLALSVCGCSSYFRPHARTAPAVITTSPTDSEQQQLEKLKKLHDSLGADDIALKQALQAKITETEANKANTAKLKADRQQAALAKELLASLGPEDGALKEVLAKKIATAEKSGMNLPSEAVPASVPAHLNEPTNGVPHLELPPAGLSPKLTELAYDGRIDVPSETRSTKVDALSVLQLDFPRYSETNAVGEPNPQWKPVLAMLRFLNDAATRMDEINLRQPQNATERLQLHRDSAAAAQRAADLIRELSANRSLGLSQSEIADIVLGEHPSLAGFKPSPNGYVNLGHWLTAKMQELRDEFQRLATNQQVKVSVQAFRDSNGDKSALHVDGWDTFAEGPYQPIDRTGLRPTPAEQGRLNADRQQAEIQKRLYESIVSKESPLRQALSSKPAEVEQMLKQLAERLTSFPAELQADQYRALTNKLAELATDARSPAAVLLRELEAFQKDVAQAKALVNEVRTLLNQAKNLKQASPDELMFGGTSLFAQAGNALRNFTGIISNLHSLPDRIERIQKALPLVAEPVLQGQAEAAMQSVTNFLSSLGPEFTQVAEDATALLNQILGTIQTLPMTTSIKKPEGDWTPRTLDNLVSGRLDLRRSSIALGDLVSIRVSATNEATGEMMEPVLYETEVGLMGFHGKPEVHFIIARALSGPGAATQWKPNVAAAVEWHYTIRDPTGWQKTWNWLYPGVGIHLANLDQGSDSVELGVGAILSLWDGLLTGGYGYNFSDNPDHQYVFVGINLLNLLERGKKEWGNK